MDQKNNVSISVAMLTYKHEKFLSQAIEGILNQQLPYPLELVISDDAASEDTKKIVDYYIDHHPAGKNIRFFSHKKNLGMVANFRFTLSQCSGKYIAYCEGDDYWTDYSKLRKQIEFLELNPEYVVSYHNAKKVDESDNIISESVLPLKEQRDYTGVELQQGAWLLSLTLCFRNVIKTFPPEFTNVPNPDSFFTALLGEYGNCKFQSGITPASYRVHSGGVFSLMGEKQNLIHRTETHRLLLNYYSRIKNRQLKKHYLTLYSRNASKLCEIYLSESDKPMFKKLKKEILYNTRKFGTIRSYLSTIKYFNLRKSALK